MKSIPRTRRFLRKVSLSIKTLPVNYSNFLTNFPRDPAVSSSGYSRVRKFRCESTIDRGKHGGHRPFRPKGDLQDLEGDRHGDFDREWKRR